MFSEPCDSVRALGRAVGPHHQASPSAPDLLVATGRIKDLENTQLLKLKKKTKLGGLFVT